MSNINFGNIKFFNNHIIYEINEGVTVSLSKNRVLVELALNYFKGKPFVFIVNRKHSYSVDPMIYSEISRIDTLKGIAVVTTDTKKIVSCKIEKLFSTKPFELFPNIEKATNWVNDLILNYPNDSSKSIAS